jgi:histidinol phosphatase-like PHP family hydrolase
MGNLAWAPAIRQPRPAPSVPGWIAGDSHTHSDASDGLVPLEEQVAWAAANGHGWIAIVDHGDALEGNLASFVRRCRAAGEAYGITVLPGVELTARANAGTPRDTGDMVVFGVGPESVLPPNQGLAEHALLRHAHADRSHPLRVIAHPTLLFKRWSHWDPEHIEGVELATGTGRVRSATIARWFALGRKAIAAGMRWPAVSYTHLSLPTN